MQAAIATRATELTLPALLYALRALGYGDQDVEFCSHLTSLHQPSLVQSVEFTESPRRATVLLNTGRLAHQWHTMTKTGRVAKLNKLNPGPFVEIHPDDAAGLGVAEGDSVEVASRRGRAVLPASVGT